jgi:hypothetical protein
MPGNALSYKKIDLKSSAKNKKNKQSNLYSFDLKPAMFFNTS